MEVGSVEYIVVVFPDNRFKGEIMPAIQKLVEKKIVRVLDLALVRKDRDGSATAFEISDLSAEEAKPFRSLETEYTQLLNDEDLKKVADALEPNSSGAILVWENLWMIETANAIRNAGGILLDHQAIPQDVVQEALDYARQVPAGV